MKMGLFFVMFVFLACGLVYADFSRLEGLEETGIKRVAFSRLDSHVLYAASGNAVFKVNTSSGKAKKIAGLKDELVQDMFVDLDGTLYVAASRRLYRFHEGKREPLFTAPDENSLLCVYKHKGRLFLGTAQGCYCCDEDIKTWSLCKGLPQTAVYSLDAGPDCLYAAAAGGVYAISGDSAQRLMVVREGIEEDPFIQPRLIRADRLEAGTLWLVTNRGLFVSRDNGANWQKTLAGFDSADIYSILQRPAQKDILYAGTSHGVFRLDLKTNKAEQLYQGLFSAEVFWLADSPRGVIYAATARGLFKLGAVLARPLASLSELMGGEPAVSEVQNAALRYNEVHPDKIKSWRRGLKLRPLMPTVSLNYDKTLYGSYSVSTTSRTGYGGWVDGPRDWGVSLSWDAADLVWNTYEDDVDTRSRLSAQLRIDIIEDVNRVYFERLRLKGEMAASGLPADEQVQKNLRMQELTAILDGYTGGFYSKRLQELASN